MIGLNYRMTDLQIALLWGNWRCCRAAAERADRAALLSELLSRIPHVRRCRAGGHHANDALLLHLPVRPESGSRRRTAICSWRRSKKRAFRATAVLRGGLPQRPVLRDAAELRAARLDGAGVTTRSPLCVSERAAYEEAVWLFPVLPDRRGRGRPRHGAAIEKVSENLALLAQQDPSLAGVKAMGRAQRARVGRARTTDAQFSKIGSGRVKSRSWPSLGNRARRAGRLAHGVGPMGRMRFSGRWPRDEVLAELAHRPSNSGSQTGILAG